MLSNVKKLQIANCVYANVAGRFAMFNNPKYRGPHFTWDQFILDCKREADLWIIIHDIKTTKNNKKQAIEYAQLCAQEIAQNLVHRLLK